MASMLDGLRFLLTIASCPLAFAGAVFTFVALQGLSRFILLPEQIEDSFASVYQWLPWVLILGAAAALHRFLPVHRSLTLGLLVAGIAGGSCGHYGTSGIMGTQRLFRGPQNAFATLQWYTPSQCWSGGEVQPLSAFNAAAMGCTHAAILSVGAPALAVSFVPADQASNGPLVVSVNPVDANTWGAAALSLRGHCSLYLQRRTPPPAHLPGPGRVEDLWGQLPDGESCQGSRATVENLAAYAFPDKGFWPK